MRGAEAAVHRPQPPRQQAVLHNQQQGLRCYLADQLTLCLDATSPGIYRQRETSSLQRLFRTRFVEICARYQIDFATRLGRFRLNRISSVVK